MSKWLGNYAKLLLGFRQKKTEVLCKAEKNNFTRCETKHFPFKTKTKKNKELKFEKWFLNVSHSHPNKSSTNLFPQELNCWIG